MKGKFVYLFIVTFIFLAIFSLPFIKIPISVSSPGLVTDYHQDHAIVTTVSGRVIKSNIERNNQFFNKGDTLLVINTEHLIDYKMYQSKQVEDYIQQSYDLDILSKGIIAGVRSDLYKKQVSLLLEKEAEIKADVDLATKDFERTKRLFEEGISSQAEYDKIFYKLESLERQLESVKEEYISKWQVEKRDVDRILRESKKEIDVTSKTISDYVIKSPITGRLVNLSAIQSGGYVNGGMKIGDISPESLSIIKVKVSPKDIGFIKKEQPIKIQVEAFNHNQWGLLEGEVLEVQNNVSFEEQSGQPYFTVLCSTEKDYLELKNGYKGKIVKGMTVTVRFYLLDRTLWQLLFDNIDDWFNPKLS
ncbi:HlyD family secretion protein [Sphingobacterium faecium]|uniref:HlyD family secretion protein n=1 Tax=Sphingobacterium faecium TaxID=34087 RepID=UPI003DA561F7